MKDIQLVIFDIDGTLVSSEAGIIYTFQHTFKKNGIEGIADDEIRELIGVSLEDMYRGFLPKWSEEDITRIAAEYREEYRKVYKEYTRKFPDADAVLQSLQHKALLSTATGKAQSVAEELIEAMGWGNIFASVYGATPNVQSKPAADIVLQSMQQHKIDAQHAVMIGDSPVDIGAGKAAGTYTIGVTTGHFSKEQLEQSGADIVVDQLQDILKHI